MKWKIWIFAVENAFFFCERGKLMNVIIKNSMQTHRHTAKFKCLIECNTQLTIKCGVNFRNVETANGRSNQTVCACGECCVELRLVTWNLINRLNLVEVEGKFAWNAAVQTSLQICRPVLAEDVLATGVLFADASNTWVNRFPAIDVLDRCFTEKEVDIFVGVERSHKIWFLKKKSKKWENKSRICPSLSGNRSIGHIWDLKKFTRTLNLNFPSIFRVKTIWKRFLPNPDLCCCCNFSICFLKFK